MHNGWSDRPITEEQIQLLYELTISGSTTANSQPQRFIFAVRRDQKNVLFLFWPSVMSTSKTRAAPLTVIEDYGMAF